MTGQSNQWNPEPAEVQLHSEVQVKETRNGDRPTEHKRQDDQFSALTWAAPSFNAINKNKPLLSKYQKGDGSTTSIYELLMRHYVQT